MEYYLIPIARRTQVEVESKDTLRRVAGVPMAGTKQVLFEIVSYSEFEALVSCCGGSVDKRKAAYLNILPVVYETVPSIAGNDTSGAFHGYFTYFGWFSRQGLLVPEITLHFINRALSLQPIPLYFFDTQ